MKIVSSNTILPKLVAISGLLLLAGCGDGDTEQEAPPVRGLKVFEVAQSASMEARRYPSIIQSANESRLSFEISGQLAEVSLEEGQRVTAGQLLMQLDPTSLQLELREARSAENQADVALRNAQADFKRKSQLIENGNVTRADFDDSQTNLRTAEAQKEQASQRLAIAQERLSKSELRAPFGGVIADVEGKSFTNVNAGGSVVTLYSQSAFEVRFNVPATVINLLSVGDDAEVIISDLPGITLKGNIREISSRASQVSAFPIIVALNEGNPGLKAGMAAEAIIRFALPGSVNGFLVPISSFDFEGLGDFDRQSVSERTAEGSPSQVFLFDEASSTVKATPVSIVGVRGNMLIVARGLKEDDLIAAAGVSYLYDGQKVSRLPDNRPSGGQ